MPINVASKYLIFFWFLVSCSSLVAQGSAQPEYYNEDYQKSTYNKRTEAVQLFEQGKTEYENGDFGNALESFNKALALKPDHTMAYFYRAGIKEHQKNYKGALTDYDIVIHFDPEFNEAFFNRGMLRYKLEDYSGAIVDFTKLLSMPSPTTQVVYYKGTAYGDGGPGSTGIISMYSKDADIYNFLGLSRTRLADINGALHAFDRAISINPYDANFFVNRGLAHIAGKNMESANADFRRALILEPDHALALFNLNIYGDNSENNLEKYDEMIGKNEDFPMAYINRGLIKYRAQKYQDAISDYNHAIKLDPSNSLAILNRALAYEKLEKYPEALKDLNKAIKLDPHLYKAYSTRGNIYYKLQDYESALQDYNEIMDSDDVDVSLFYNRALVKYKLKLNDDACHDLKYAIEHGYEAAKKALDAYCK